MDEICSRFPHLAIDILKRLDYESLKKCALTSRRLNVIITKQTNLWFKVLSSISRELILNGNFSDYHQKWSLFLKNLKTNTIINFAGVILKQHQIWLTMINDTPLDLVLKNHHLFRDYELMIVLKNIMESTHLETIATKFIEIKILKDIALRLNQTKQTLCLECSAMKMGLAAFANGSYHNGVSRALWAVDLQICQISDTFDILLY